MLTATIAPPGVEYVEDLRERLSAYIQENDRKQAHIARELNVSPTALSQFLSGIYPGNNQELARKVEQFLIIGAARQKLTQAPPVSVEVSHTKKILQRLTMTHIARDILLIYGPAGCGKTTALRYYAGSKNGVIYIEADVTMNTHRTVLVAILDEMGENSTGSTNVLMRRLVALLRDTGRLIILDEAQHLTEKALEVIRALNDKAGVGIVFAGNPRIVSQMYGRKKDDFDQVYSRIGYHCELDNRYKAADIQAIFSHVDLDKDCLSYLHRISKRQGCLRLLVKQYKLAANIAASMGHDLSVVHLEEAAKRMGIGGKA